MKNKYFVLFLIVGLFSNCSLDKLTNDKVLEEILFQYGGKVSKSYGTTIDTQTGKQKYIKIELEYRPRLLQDRVVDLVATNISSIVVENLDEESKEKLDAVIVLIKNIDSKERAEITVQLDVFEQINLEKEKMQNIIQLLEICDIPKLTNLLSEKLIEDTGELAMFEYLETIQKDVFNSDLGKFYFRGFYNTELNEVDDDIPLISMAGMFYNDSLKTVHEIKMIFAKGEVEKFIYSIQLN